MTEFALKDRVSVNGMPGTIIDKSYTFGERTYIVRFDTGHEDTFKGSQLQLAESEAA